VKISCKSVWKFFLRKIAKRETDKQTNNDDYITSLAEITNKVTVNDIVSALPYGDRKRHAYKAVVPC